ncbi:hypothetical protein HYS92_02090 [Candidatus Daviesbacteria bacterium]|nr:hypothetical protein [Candidatus Daviesbacteria bacterium]
MRNWLKKLFHLNQAGIIHLLPLLLLLAGIIAGVYLVQKEGFQLFKPKATAINVEFSGNCVQNGVLTCADVQIKFTSPLGD